MPEHTSKTTFIIGMAILAGILIIGGLIVVFSR
jgi:hypothetical protein